MGLGDQARKAWDRMAGQAQPEPKRDAASKAAEPQKAAEPVRPALKRVSTMETVQIGGRAPMARAFPELRSQLHEGLKHSVQPEKPAAPEQAKPVEREATKLQPKLQPPRTPGPGPSPNPPNTIFVNRTSTANQKAKAPTPTPQPKEDVGLQKQTQPPKARKSLSDYERQDKDAADKQKSADQQQQPGRKTVEQYSRSSGKDQDKSISR